jgi:hypothetical protein
VLPPSNTATLLIILNLLTILMSTLILHLSFFGRLLALYKRNLNRVECLSKILSTTLKEQLDSWWSCRNFVLNDDLSLDYDIGGLAVSATFLIAITLFAALISQVRVENSVSTTLRSTCVYFAYYLSRTCMAPLEHVCTVPAFNPTYINLLYSGLLCTTLPACRSAAKGCRRCWRHRAATWPMRACTSRAA